MKTIVIMNESHSMMEDQERVMKEHFGEDWEVYPVPASGWTKEEMDEQMKKMREMNQKHGGLNIVFLSPVPYMLMELTRNEMYAPSAEYCENTGLFVHVLHNDRREKKELPNGRYISVIAKEGWQLL